MSVSINSNDRYRDERVSLRHPWLYRILSSMNLRLPVAWVLAFSICAAPLMVRAQIPPSNNPNTYSTYGFKGFTPYAACMAFAVTNVNYICGGNLPEYVYSIKPVATPNGQNTGNCNTTFFCGSYKAGPYSDPYDRVRQIACPPGYPQSGASCGNSSPTTADPNLNKGRCPVCEGNPINPLVGNKYQIELDYKGDGAFPIILERVYNSFGMAPGSPAGSAAFASGSTAWTVFVPPSSNGGIAVTPTVVGIYTNSPTDFGWRHSYDRTLVTASASTSTATLYRGDSKTRTFTKTNGVWVADQGQLMTILTPQVNGSGSLLGWTYTNENDEIERYDQDGRLLSITNRAGLMQTLQYDYNKTQIPLSSVTDAFGHQLTFSYNAAGNLSAINTPDGGKYIYSYTSDGNNNLSTVTYPDGRSRQYVYENASFVGALTGIIDENGNRFATWSYDSQGNAITSEHAVGIEKVTLSYPSLTTSIATDAGGASRTYSPQIVNGIAKVGMISETCGSNCSRSRSMTYEADGNVATSTDFNGTVTTYSYDLTRDLETSRVEGAGTPQARTITTAWHATYRLPLMIAEPKLLTTYAYDTSGNLLSKTVQATSDANGTQGLSPTLVGTARTWSYTYNSVGQVLTATGPRTDVTDKTTYTYDSNGNPSTITNAVGQVTTLSNYDANGRVGLITDANGATTALTYSPRGWLTGKTVTSDSTVETTTYGYDGVGQLSLVTLPNTSTVSYTYDPAHRLTNITDSLGNSITYTLDNMGNRISEQVKDPSGALARQTSRVVDALNRIQKITGNSQ